MRRFSYYFAGGVMIGALGLTAMGANSHLLGKRFSERILPIGSRIENVLSKVDNIVTGTTPHSPLRAQQAVDVPWAVNFANTDLSDFTVIDGNDDDITWQYGNGVAEAPYSAKDQMDDWLVSPPLNMSGGMPYTVTVMAAANSTAYNERMEICYGSDKTVVAMTQVAKEAFVIEGTDYKAYTGRIVPNLSEPIFIGLHGISDPDMYKILVQSIEVTLGCEGEMPSGVSNLTIGSSNPYALTADISFNAPSYKLDGGALTDLTRIEVRRNDELIKTINSPAPGSLQQLTDQLAQGGDYQYSVTAFNNAGEGYTMTQIFHVGTPAPEAPETVFLEETADGVMKLTWSPVTKDVEGNDIPAGMVKYIIVDTEMELIAEDVTSTEITFSITSQDQIFVECLVAAYTMSGGVGDARMSNVRAVGRPYDGAGWSESFAGGYPETLMGVGYEFGFVDFVGWDVATDETFDNSESPVPAVASDGDNGFVFMQSEYGDTGASLFTGKMKLPQEGVAVMFDVFNQGTANIPDENLVELMVSEDGDEWTVVDSRTVAQICGSAQGWNEATVGLQRFAGKTVMLRWQVTVNSYGLYLMDNLRIVGLPACDVAVRNLQLPSIIEPNDFNMLSVEVCNMGEEAVDRYELGIYANGVEIGRIQRNSLAAGEVLPIQLPFTVAPVMGDEVGINVSVILSGDAVAENNSTEVKQVRVNLPKTPYVTDLEGSVSENGQVTLQWSEPVLTGYAPGNNEGFEDGEDFAGEFKDWIFIDRDGGTIGDLNPSHIPGIVAGETAASFMVFNQSAPSFNSSMHAHSGDKYLASIFNFYGEQNDDWVITPELNGTAQVVSFWARSLEFYYAETMEIYYSFGSTNPNDFVKIITVDKVPGEWTEYQIPIPNGAKRFAVRNVSHDCMALMLDDFFFADASSPVGIELQGYNIYCDAQKIGSVDKNTHTFSHIGTNGEHVYSVTAVYAETGESRGSNNLTLTVTGGEDSVGIVGADGYGIIKEGRSLHIVGHAGESLNIWIPDGACYLAKDNLRSEECFELPAGIYIVKAGTSVRKIRF